VPEEVIFRKKQFTMDRIQVDAINKNIYILFCYLQTVKIYFNLEFDPSRQVQFILLPVLILMRA